MVNKISSSKKISKNSKKSLTSLSAPTIYANMSSLDESDITKPHQLKTLLTTIQSSALKVKPTRSIEHNNISRKSESRNTNISTLLPRDIESKATIYIESASSNVSCNVPENKISSISNINNSQTTFSNNDIVKIAVVDKSNSKTINAGFTEKAIRENKDKKENGIDSELLNFVDNEVKRLSEQSQGSTSGESMDLDGLVNTMLLGIDDGTQLKKHKKKMYKKSNENDIKFKASIISNNNIPKIINSNNNDIVMKISKSSMKDNPSRQSVQEKSFVYTKGDDGLDSTLLKYVDEQIARLEGRSEDSSMVSADLSMLNRENNKILNDLNSIDGKSRIGKKISNTSNNTVTKYKHTRSSPKKINYDNSSTKFRNHKTNDMEFNSSELGGISELSKYVNDLGEREKEEDSSDSGPIGNSDIKILDKVCDKFIKTGNNTKVTQGSKSSTSKLEKDDTVNKKTNHDFY